MNQKNKHQDDSHQAEEDLTSELEGRAFQLASKPTSMLKKLQRTAQVLKHYRWSQIALRIRNTALAKLQKHAVVKAYPIPSELGLRNLEICRPLAKIIVGERAGQAAEIDDQLQRGQVTLLNHAVTVGQPINWSAAEQTHLWRFQLHYHEFLLALVATDASEDNSRHVTIRQSVASWLEQNAAGKTLRSHDSWHPYCISRRIPVWAWLLSLGVFPDAHLHDVTNSLFQQACHLHSNLEKDLGGNHLLENLVALAMAAVVLETPQSNIWLQTVHTNLQRELKHQVLDHGEHFELAPAYHCQVLSNLLRVAWLCRDVRPDLAALCLDRAEKMFEFLHLTTHPDGEIALFGDSVFLEAPSVQEINRVAQLHGWSVTPEEKNPQTPDEQAHELGGYWIFRHSDAQQSDFLIFDRGETAAAHLPAHGHCDLLGFEASVSGRRWFVDSGNFNYENDSMRTYCRSSLAHNVVTVEGLNQSEIWSAFRMGNRSRILTTESGSKGEFVWASGSRDAYGRQGVHRMQRLMAVSATRKTWLCADVAELSTGAAQLMDRAEMPCLTGYLHLAPEVQVSFGEGDQAELELSDGHSSRTIAFFNSEVEIVSGWYCPQFGKRQQNGVLVYNCLNHREPFGWQLRPSDSPTLLLSTSENELLLCDTDSKTMPPVFEWKF